MGAKLTSFVTVEAKARIKPARAASMVGVRIDTKAARPTMTAEKRLNRMDNHLFTIQNTMRRGRIVLHALYAHLPTSNSTG